ncbi:MAG: hypothetical protein AUI14_25540 [Actinobacteria bacterium 13_2_20CM_2_71_6]|nr:MAG: hypothetical protein AUI14_25540 [Actinobacteria bacterium 13_2_20CM_2_71_6]
MREFTVNDRITLAAKVAAGAMHVSAGPRDTATVDVQPYDDSRGAREAAERTIVELRGDTLVVDAPKGTWRLMNRARIRVNVQLPDDSRLHVRLASADGVFQGRYGDSTVETASGDIAVGHVAGQLRISSASGDVRVDRVDGQLSVDTASGDIVIGSTGGELAVSTASGDLTVAQAEASVRAQSASGDLRFGAVRRGTVRIHTASGDVRVGVPAGTSVWLDLVTASGSTRSDLDYLGDAGPAGGTPDLNLHVRTASGDIELRRVNVPATA